MRSIKTRLWRMMARNNNKKINDCERSKSKKDEKKWKARRTILNILTTFHLISALLDHLIASFILRFLRLFFFWCGWSDEPKGIIGKGKIAIIRKASWLDRLANSSIYENASCCCWQRLRKYFASASCWNGKRRKKTWECGIKRWVTEREYVAF